MPRIDKSVYKGLGLDNFISAERTIVNEVLEVTVLSDELIFDQFVTGMYDAIASRWEMFHPGGAFPVTSEQFSQYAYTAVKARVSRVRNERFHVRCDDQWALPAPLAAVLAGVGEVMQEAPIFTVRPKWDARHEDKILSYGEWEIISRRLRAVERDENCRFIFAHAIDGGKTGDEVLMCLIPVRGADGRIVQLEGGAKMDVDPIAAVAYLILGLEPQDAEGLALPTHALRRSPWSFKASVLTHVLGRFAEASVG